VTPPESRPPRLTEAEQRQLDELERRLANQFPDLAGNFSGGRPPRLERRRVAIVFAAVGVALIVLAAVVGGVGGALAVLCSLAATAGVVALLHRRAARPGPQSGPGAKRADSGATGS
jgi:membrane-associated phospholipid phosphatase